MKQRLARILKILLGLVFIVSAVLKIADMDRFNENVAPRAVSMVGKPYKCK